MHFIPKDERPWLALLADLKEEQALELSGALSTAYWETHPGFVHPRVRPCRVEDSDELGGDELLQHVVSGTPSIEGDDVRRILRTVRQVASAKEVLEVQPDVFLNDIAEGMGEIEEQELRLDRTKQRPLLERLGVLTKSPAVEIHAKARSLQQDRENTFCRARIVTDLRPIFGPDVRQSPKAVLVAHMLRISYHHGSQAAPRDLFISLRTEDLDQLSELIERARLKAESLHAFTAAADLREIN